MTAADLESFFGTMHRRYRDGRPVKPEGDLIDPANFQRWFLLTKSRGRGVPAFSEPACEWPDEWHHDFDLLDQWDTWARNKHQERASIDSRMSNMASWMKLSKF